MKHIYYPLSPVLYIGLLLVVVRRPRTEIHASVVGANVRRMPGGWVNGEEHLILTSPLPLVPSSFTLHFQSHTIPQSQLLLLRTELHPKLIVIRN